MPGLGTRDTVVPLNLFWERSRETAYPLTFSSSAESRLDSLFQTATRQMESEGVSEIYEKIDEAAGNAQRLIHVARDKAIEQNADANTIEVAHIEAAMFSLCPIWPFCSKRWP
jgi:hypothetical protein